MQDSVGPFIKVPNPKKCREFLPPFGFSQLLTIFYFLQLLSIQIFLTFDNVSESHQLFLSQFCEMSKFRIYLTLF